MLLPFLLAADVATESPLALGNVGSFAESPMATKRVKSGVTARSVIRMAVIPQESRCFPSDPWTVAQRRQFIRWQVERRQCLTHRLILRSWEPEMNPDPSGTQASADTVSVWASMVRMRIPDWG